MNKSTKYYAYKVSDDVLVGTDLDLEEALECVRIWARDGEVVVWKEQDDLTTFGYVRDLDASYVACVDCHTSYNREAAMNVCGVCHCGNDLNRNKSVEDNSMSMIEKLEQHMVETAVITNLTGTVTIMAGDLMRNGMYPKDALAVSSWFCENYSNLGDIALDDISMMIDGVEVPVVLDRDVVINTLQMSGYLTAELDRDVRFAEVCAMETKAYLPALASNGVDRRFNYGKTKPSELMVEAHHALESSEYTVDTYMLDIAKKVLSSGTKDPEGYVIAGCDQMDPELAYVSEFKPDARGRMYQASCHGPNGQASDRSRALMDLYGVPQDYDNAEMLEVLKAEMLDMVSCDKGEMTSFIKLAYDNPVQFILDEHEEVGKPYTFVKASRIFVGLVKGEKPYLGLAIGLDAKCSGPQLGALMVGDSEVAAACGFSTVEVDDAYHNAVSALTKAGIKGFTRALVKKPFMGIFYGQGWQAFTDFTACEDIFTQIHGEETWCAETMEMNAKRFHAAVVSAFGDKLLKLRNAMKSYSDKIDSPIEYMLPDGFKVKMGYEYKQNVEGAMLTHGGEDEALDVIVQSGMTQVRLEKYATSTGIKDLPSFARNGFVNLIQATDGLLARLIVVHLKRMGAQHIISVHDCFRVNMTEMPMLVEAIKRAYLELFGKEKNKFTADLPKGSDILDLYFKGANRSVMAEEPTTTYSQFTTSTGIRKGISCSGKSFTELVGLLGTTYFFAK